MAVLQRTPDLGIGIHLQRPAAAPDAARSAGWLLPNNVYVNIVDGSEPWLPAHVEVSRYVGYDEVVKVNIGVAIVGVVSGETVTGIQWEWHMSTSVPVDAAVEVVDGHLRATIISMTGKNGDSCTLFATVKTASGFSRTITARFYLYHVGA